LINFPRNPMHRTYRGPSMQVQILRIKL
jgi:hypothetical protein